jgi:DNA mismatch endonuclease (patch repair protein)
MRANKATNTRAELLLRKHLWRLGLRYRLHAKDLPGKPDIVFRGKRLAIFCDGDFWHGRNWEERQRKLRKGSNASYWLSKIGSNRERDARHNAALAELGWTVVRLWESDILKDPDGGGRQVKSALLKLRLRPE